MSSCTPKDCERLFSNADKWRVSILAGLIFMLVSSPFLYNLVDKVTSPLNLNVANNGCPTMLGLFLMTVLFVVITRALM